MTIQVQIDTDNKKALIGCFDERSAFQTILNAELIKNGPVDQMTLIDRVTTLVTPIYDYLRGEHADGSIQDKIHRLIKTERSRDAFADKSDGTLDFKEGVRTRRIRRLHMEHTLDLLALIYQGLEPQYQW